MNMIQKKAKKEHRTHKKGVVFEDEVIALLTKNRCIKRAQVVQHMLEDHKGELGYSEKTINKKLDQMIKNGDIISLKFKDLFKYGIKEEDKRVSYLILKKTVRINEDLNKIFYYITLGEPSVQKLALKKIKSHSGEYLLDPYQLDVLVSCLHSKDDNLVNDLLDTLCEYVLGRGIEPSNKERFLEILRDLLERYTGSLEHTDLRRHVFWLLGSYRDHTVIEQIKKDAENLEDPISIVSEYCNDYVAPLIEEYALELFAFKLYLKGNEKASEFISRMEESACTIENKLKRLENNAQLDERIKKLREERTK